LFPFQEVVCCFEGIVSAGDKLKVEMQHVVVMEGRMVFKVQAYNDRSGNKVLDAEAEIERAFGCGKMENGM